MSARSHARAVAGVASVLVFLGLVAADTVDPTISLSLDDKLILLSLIASLLGLDMLREQLPGLATSGQTNGGGDDE